jgi:hypothetical protein
LDLPSVFIPRYLENPGLALLGVPCFNKTGQFDETNPENKRPNKKQNRSGNNLKPEGPSGKPAFQPYPQENSVPKANARRVIPEVTAFKSKGPADRWAMLVIWKN